MIEFISGLMTGGLFGILLMCLLQINRDNELQRRINKAIEYIENHSLYEEEYDYDYEENMYLSGINDEIAKKDLLEILGGDVNYE